MRLDFQAVNRASKARFQRSHMAKFHGGVYVELESLRLKFHVNATWTLNSSL